MSDKPKHTPGPWTAMESGAVLSHAAKEVICKCEREANARLIATAPEWLQLGKETLTKGFTLENRRELRRLIAKAEGEA